MIRLSDSLAAWGTPGFNPTFKREAEQLDSGFLPLQQGLALSSQVADSPFSVRVISVSDDAGFIRVRAGIFYAGVIAGCSCADDPTPVDTQNEYCEVRFEISKATAETRIALEA